VLRARARAHTKKTTTTTTTQQKGGGNVSSWVLGWRFAAGEAITSDRDVFGDPGTFDVFLSSLQPPAAGAAPQQLAAVFSE
jgi:hypothetical protein